MNSIEHKITVKFDEDGLGSDKLAWAVEELLKASCFVYEKAIAVLVMNLVAETWSSGDGSRLENDEGEALMEKVRQAARDTESDIYKRLAAEKESSP